MVVAGDFINNGAANLSSCTFRMTAATSPVPTVISGSGTFAKSNTFTAGVIRNLRIDNPMSVTLSVAISVSASLELQRGMFVHNGNLSVDRNNRGSGTLLNAVLLTRQYGALASDFLLGSDTPINLVYSKYVATPAVADALIVAGYEIPATRSILSLKIDNAGGVRLNEDLSLTADAPLVLTNGILTVSASKTLRCTSTAYHGAAGTAQTFVDGAIALSTGTVATTKTYPIGSSSQNRAVVLTGLAASAGTVALRVGVEIPLGGSSAPGVALSATRRWHVAVLDGTLAGYTGIGITYGADDLITSPAAIASAATLSGLYTSMELGANTATVINSPAGNYTAGGYFALAMGTESALPVNLTAFEVRLKYNAVQLDWRTINENNSDRFEVERSANGVDYVKIRTVKAQGNSVQSVDYRATDRYPYAGVNYYRLRQYDSNGTQTIYGPNSINFKYITQAVSVTKNNNDGSIDILIQGEVPQQLAVRLSNLSGQVIFRGNLHNATHNGHFKLKPTAILPSGMYIVHLTSAGINKSEKIIL
ncbi:MAG: T9SS type A sorting domain-containing protein [Sphingobacteriales bacterium]|nr:MAG: T9SS type A sorting domain-containing protein [Sphingobacteriales bacterium]